MAERDGQDDHRRQKPETSRERDDEGLRARLNTLSSALDAQAVADKAADAAKQEQTHVLPGAIGNAMGLAVRVLSEFVAAVLVGTVIGWWIDRTAGTTPAFLIVFLLLGAAAGFWNVYRIAMKPPNPEG
ncbi:AtpZ/AtpI family protein [Methylocapsa sp. D3K7]|uniref:AtpZ/AtpI family protein n=1 Tax=Methylocapsa sp. D3K7 TaxID=3041435 RepID=UPI00244ED382|nr:AtpZ/AtpI family protein [Methylocapsa sp. D3K7]WGJ15570.1 AtpZ/AtpI family protein [Methylocapsa sp. D3K7]